MKNSNICEHKNIVSCYGTGRTYGFRGLGVYQYCEDCSCFLSWDDDPEATFKEEREHNKKNLEKLVRIKG